MSQRPHVRTSLGGLRFLRDYRLRAVHSLQCAVRNGKDRFLFEMVAASCELLTRFERKI